MGNKEKIFTVGINVAFRYCPPGTFVMGSPVDEPNRFDDEKQHRVTLTKGFWIMETPVTQELYEAVMGENPSLFKRSGERAPVENVSCYDAEAFAEKLSKLKGVSFRLPTEAEWEYACRAGTTTRYYCGDSMDDAYAWYDGNSVGKTRPVNGKKPNAWGLYDMIGNVWEWCADLYSDYPSGHVTDPVGMSSGDLRVIRGGCWSSYAKNCRSAYRDCENPSDRRNYLGFRLAYTGRKGVNHEN